MVADFRARGDSVRVCAGRVRLVREPPAPGPTGPGLLEAGTRGNMAERQGCAGGQGRVKHLTGGSARDVGVVDASYVDGRVDIGRASGVQDGDTQLFVTVTLMDHRTN